MPELTFEQSIAQRADNVLITLGRVDLFRNFITGCTASVVEDVAEDKNGVISGNARIAFAVKKYGFGAEGSLAFSINRATRTVEFHSPILRVSPIPA